MVWVITTPIFLFCGKLHHQHKKSVETAGTLILNKPGAIILNAEFRINLKIRPLYLSRAL